MKFKMGTVGSVVAWIHSLCRVESRCRSRASAKFRDLAEVLLGPALILNHMTAFCRPLTDPDLKGRTEAVAAVARLGGAV